MMPTPDEIYASWVRARRRVDSPERLADRVLDRIAADDGVPDARPTRREQLLVVAGIACGVVRLIALAGILWQ